MIKCTVKERSFYMKKIMNKVNFAIICLMTVVPAFAVEDGKQLKVESGMCELITKLHGVFNVLRIAAFVGAAFYIAGWAWKYISSGEVKTDDVKKQGIALLVGFGLLFMIGAVLSFVLSASGMQLVGCEIIQKW